MSAPRIGHLEAELSQVRAQLAALPAPTSQERPFSRDSEQALVAVLATRYGLNGAPDLRVIVGRCAGPSGIGRDRRGAHVA